MALFASVEFAASCGGGLALVHVKWFTPHNLDKAKRKLKLCEDTSDLQTSEEEVACKRKRIAPRRFIEDGDDNDEENNLQRSTLPRPPRINIDDDDNPELSSEDKEETITPTTSTPY
ncbi:hypothetical protein FQR65_LT16174 [Abscondita terminalis]|nr:hypothetical protein FQR65_LT16174 [Abscondita terminalis]